MTAAPKIHGGHILYAVATYFDWFAHRMMTECEIDGGRADVVFLSKAGYATEIEVKISRSDWNADATKDKWKRERPHVAQFYYAVPVKLAERIPDWVPEHVGILSVALSDFGRPYMRTVRHARRLKAKKFPEEQARQIERSAYYRFWRAELRRLLRTFAPDQARRAA